MREMHKWKDKVELNLDNRQIFFLFFGLSVVGCFVFALGVMVGRRVEVNPSGEVAALSADSLSILDGHGEGETALTFQEGLKASSIDAVPPTRTLRPEADPAADATPSEAPAAAAAPIVAAMAAPKAAPAPSKAKPKAANPKAKAKAKAKSNPKPKADTTLASSGTSAKSAPAGARKFTLQMKAFSKKDEADSFAADLQSKGHAARVESQEVKGRLWHRVRVGSFDTWAEGLSAKERFETNEKTIAYVVRK